MRPGRMFEMVLRGLFNLGNGDPAARRVAGYYVLE